MHSGAYTLLLTILLATSATSTRSGARHVRRHTTYRPHKPEISESVRYYEPKKGASSFVPFPSKCANLCSSDKDFQALLPERPDFPKDDAVFSWSVVFLNQVKANLAELSPPGVGRCVAIFTSCMYDAATILKPDLEPSHFKGDTSELHKSYDPFYEIVSGAAFTAIEALFGDLPAFYKAIQFKNIITPVKTGNVKLGKRACEAVIQGFTSDGYNARGTDPRGDAPTSNTGQVSPGITNCAEEISDHSLWQPLCVPVSAASDECKVQEWLAPHAPEFTTLSGVDASTLLPDSGPPMHDTQKEEYLRQAQEVLDHSKNLDDRNKLIAEYWADGPDKTAPPGQWMTIALNAGESEGLDAFEKVKLLFVVGNALNDAGVAAWTLKLRANSMRPITMIQCGFGGKEVKAWKGPYQGVGTIDASVWQPYQASTFVSPAFPGWVSGHSTFSTAAARVLKLFFGNDAYKGPRCFLVKEGESDFEPKRTGGDPLFVAGETDVPNQGPSTKGYVPAEDVALCWETFLEAGEEGGTSRFHGGIHITADHTDGKKVGEEVAANVFAKAKSLWGK